VILELPPVMLPDREALLLTTTFPKFIVGGDMAS